MKWEGAPASIDALRSIVEKKSALVLSWDGHGGRDEYIDEESGTTVHGMFVDMQTANVMVKVRDALSPETQAKFDEHLTKSPGWFVKMSEVAWGAVK